MLVSGLTHRHATAEPGTVEHNHLGGGVRHDHDPETGMQINVARDDVTTDEIVVREHGICCRCGRARAAVAHHRKLRSQGGLDTWDNQVGICHDCHTLGAGAIHRNVERSYAEGWLVESWKDPATVALDYHARGRVLLGSDSSINETT